MGKKIKTIKTDLEFGQSVWIKNDPEQSEWLIVAYITLDTGAMLRVKSLEEVIEVYDFEISVTKGEVTAPKKSETDEDD